MITKAGTPKCAIDPKLPSSLYVHLQNQHVSMWKKQSRTSTKKTLILHPLSNDYFKIYSNLKVQKNSIHDA